MSEETDFVVPCGNHPDQRATHNCMNCGKPLCMTCVAERGYYCSDACKSAVQATVPSTPRDESLDKVDAQMDRGMAVASSLFRKLVKPVILLLILVAGFYTYRAFFGPKGTVTVNIPVTSEVEVFHAEVVGPDTVIVRANDELSRLTLSTQAKVWTVNLQPFEPVHEADGLTFRERLDFVGVRGDEILFRSRDKLIGFDAQTGQQQKQATNADHEGTLWGHHFVTLDLVPPPKQEVEPESEPEITAGDPEMFSAKRLLGLAKGEAPAPTATEYIVKFDGTGESRLAFTDFPQIHALGDQLIITGGRNLAVFASAAKPLWQAQLDADITDVALGGDVIAVATEKGVVAFDAKSGQQRWARTDLESHKVAVAPDGTVYARISLSAEDAKKSEDKYRFAKVALAGMGSPFADVPVLLKLDARDGQTRWGVRNIGEHVLFAGDKVFVADATEQLNLLAAAGPFQGYYSVRQLNPRNGAEVWSYIAKGLLYEAHVAGDAPFLIAAEDPPAGRRNPVGIYLLQVVKGR